MKRLNRLMVAGIGGGMVLLMGGTAMANMQLGVRVVDCETQAPMEGVLVHGFIGAQLDGDEELYDYTDENGYAYLAGQNQDNVLYCSYQDQNHACAVRFEMEGYQTTYMRKTWINTAEAVVVNGTAYANYYRHYTEEGGHPLNEMTVEICPVNNILDFDNDGVEDGIDNCPSVSNPGAMQADADGDGVGDICDNCPNVPNFDQLDGDLDGVGDLCTQRTQTIPDTDRDGISNDIDNCPSIPNPNQADSDNNGIGDFCDYGEEIPETGTPVNNDTDYDGVPNDIDNCPSIPNRDQDPSVCAGLPSGGGSGGSGSGGGTPNSQDDGASSEGGDEGGSEVSSGGCSVTPGAPNSGLAATLLLGLALLIRRRS